jgi:hypothetical protein
MERQGAEPSLHQRLIVAIDRGGEVQECSREIVEEHIAADKRLAATLAFSRRARRERAQERDVRNRT